MAKKVEKLVKLQIPAGKATPAPPVGPALGQAGINIMGFTKEFNARTADQAGMIIPVVISVYEDKSFNNPNVEIGTVAVWKGPGVNKKGGWIGHIATIVDVKRDSNSNVISITTIEGHTGGGQTAVEINSAIDWASYKGEFLGFGEIGRDSTEAFPKTTENSVKGKWYEI